jgi:Na+-translocating ferredoxin:NAD+ oxidoreductase RNF subunit RnfB
MRHLERFLWVALLCVTVILQAKMDRQIDHNKRMKVAQASFEAGCSSEILPHCDAQAKLFGNKDLGTVVRSTCIELAIQDCAENSIKFKKWLDAGMSK